MYCTELDGWKFGASLQRTGKPVATTNLQVRYVFRVQNDKGATISRNPLILWWASRESNTAPTDYESAALTKHELEARNLTRN